MSTIQVTNISDGTISVPSTVVTEAGSKAAFVYNQVTPAVTRSYNITSVSDDATGLFTASITNAFDAADYTNLTGTGESGTVGIRGMCLRNGGTGKTASACEFQSHTTAAVVDLALDSASFQGDLA